MYSAHGESIAPRKTGGQGIQIRTRQSKANAKILTERAVAPGASGYRVVSAPGFLIAVVLPIGSCCRCTGGN